MMCNRLKNEGFGDKQADEDADTLIVNTTIEESNQNETVIIVREGPDLLVILTTLNGSRSNIYFQKPGKGKTQKIERMHPIICI